MNRSKWRGFTLIELLVVVAIIALLISILLPSLSRARELSKRVACSANARAIGNACKIYAAEPWNADQWPVPTFNPTLIGNSAGGVKYTSALNDGNNEDADLGNPPQRETPSDKDANGEYVSTTRAFWMLIRAGETVPKTYVCPSSGDTPDDTEEIDRYYDFKSIRRVSYGYQVPFGPVDTRPSENVDTRMAMVADKGPYGPGTSIGPDGMPGAPPNPLTLDPPSPVRDWMRHNSPNHGGRGAGEGQNIFFADGHVDFQQTPIQGVDHDNIYSQMTDGATEIGRISGKSPQEGNPANPFPGQNVFGTELKDRATSDSLIWP